MIARANIKFAPTKANKKRCNTVSKKGEGGVELIRALLIQQFPKLKNIQTFILHASRGKSDPQFAHGRQLRIGNIQFIKPKMGRILNRGPINHAENPRPMACAQTHGTGFAGRIDGRTAPQPGLFEWPFAY